MLSVFLAGLLLAAAAAFREPPSDEALMLAYKAGDVAAFNQLFTRHQGAVLRFMLRSTRSAPRSEEMTQEVFFRVVRMAPTYEPRAKFRTWLFTIARNLCIDESRKPGRGKTDSLDEPIGEDGSLRRIDLFADDSHIPADQRPVRGEFNAKVARALEVMPAEQREVFELRVVAELRFPEIASVLATNEDTIKARFRYACAKLRAALSDYAGFSFDAPGGGKGGGADEPA